MSIIKVPNSTMGKVRNVQNIEQMRLGFDAEALVTVEGGEPYPVYWKRIALPDLFGSRIIDGYLTIEVRGRPSLELFYRMLEIVIDPVRLNKDDFVKLYLPNLQPEQVRVVNVVAKADSPTWRGMIQVRLVNPTK
jgi:hypothetical protein